ncbi:hypothetical protein PSCLAVI8L_320100 [Pseudoclavibacter sp. 8L]|nr:hypothetical protein PSCLAVI8L_320100 [Pseudoclavibacter sp. 8L]
MPLCDTTSRLVSHGVLRCLRYEAPAFAGLDTGSYLKDAGRWCSKLSVENVAAKTTYRV